MGLTWAGELAVNHVGLSGHVSHWYGVARSRAVRELQTIGNLFSNTEVDEVVRRCEGRCLASFCTIASKTIGSQVGTNSTRIKLK